MVGAVILKPVSSHLQGEKIIQPPMQKRITTPLSLGGAVSSRSSTGQRRESLYTTFMSQKALYAQYWHAFSL